MPRSKIDHLERQALDACRLENRRIERDWVMHHLEQAERILNTTFNGVGVAHLDDARKTLIEEEFPDE
jgi:hypothetical protein